MSELSRPGDLARGRALLVMGRLLARRLRLARWLLALVLGVGVALWTIRLIDDAEYHREQWSTTTDIWVLTVDVPSGSILEAHHVERRTLPDIAIPETAVRTEIDSPAGRRIRVDGHRGEILLRPRIAPDGASAVAARLPDGTRGIVIPTDENDPFEVGDEADLFDLITGRRIIDAVLVVAVGPGGTTFAVDVDRASSVIGALAGGGVTAALVP